MSHAGKHQLCPIFSIYGLHFPNYSFNIISTIHYSAVSITSCSPIQLWWKIHEETLKWQTHHHCWVGSNASSLPHNSNQVVPHDRGFTGFIFMGPNYSLVIRFHRGSERQIYSDKEIMDHCKTVPFQVSLRAMLSTFLCFTSLLRNLVLLFVPF